MAELYPALEQRLAVVLRDREEARDIAQEAYLRAYRAWPRFDGSDPRAWLYTIGLRLAFNELRRRRSWLSILDRTSPPAEPPPPADPDLWNAIGQLDPRHRAALVLHVVDGYTQAEIGRMLDAPSGTVGSWIGRAKEKLRQSMGDRS